MSTYLKKGNDYHILFNIIDKNEDNIALSFFSSYEVVLEKKDGTEIRTLKTDNTEEDGKLYEYDSETLEFYIETRDSDDNDLIRARVKTQWDETKLYDDKFDNNKVIDTYIFQTE